MGIITDSKGNKIGEFADTLVDWRQAAQVEAQLRREAHKEISKLKTAIRNMLDALDCNDESAAYAYAKTALGNEQRVERRRRDGEENSG